MSSATLGKQRQQPNVSEYEQKRLKNIADNKVVLAKLMDDLKSLAPLPIQSPPRKTKSHRDRQSAGVVRRNPSRNARYNPINYTPPRTRSRRNSTGSSSGGSSGATTPVKSPNRLFIKFGAFFKKSKNTDGDDASDSLSIYDEDECSLKSPTRKPRSVPRVIKPADEITEEDLDLVANFVSDKSYDSAEGSTCHQCRQKTNDMKTICRNEHCAGVRGQFCGPCLRNRYGEDAKTALKNPAWICPPCRGICNCSFCRKRAGRSCTGILIHIAREHGFPDVNSYLQSFKA